MKDVLKKNPLFSLRICYAGVTSYVFCLNYI